MKFCKKLVLLFFSFYLLLSANDIGRIASVFKKCDPGFFSQNSDNLLEESETDPLEETDTSDDAQHKTFQSFSNCIKVPFSRKIAISIYYFTHPLPVSNYPDITTPPPRNA